MLTQAARADVEKAHPPFAKLPKRLQSMLLGLQLQRHDIGLTYQKGTDMHVADTLSRTSVYVTQAASEQSSFEKELEMVCAVETGLLC